MNLETLNPDVVEEICARHGACSITLTDAGAGPLIGLAEAIAGHVKGSCMLALSGILSEQVDEVLDAYRPWIEFEEPVTREQGGQAWARLTGRRIEG